MPVVQIQVQLGTGAKTFSGKQKRITVGTAADCDLVLPLPFVQLQHLILENSADVCRVKAGSASARTLLAGRALPLDWTLLALPARLEIPNSKGKAITLDIASSDSFLHAVVLRDPSLPADAPSIADLSVPAPQDDLPPEPVAALSRATRTLTVALFSTIGLFVILAVLALCINRARTARETRRLAADTQFVADKLQVVHNLVTAANYRGALDALNTAEAAARRTPSIYASVHDQIDSLRQTPEIRLGAQGYVLIEGQWLTPDMAHALQAARAQDDQRIADLENKAATEFAAHHLDTAQTACEEAIAIMQAEPVQPHPRYAPVKGQLETIKTALVTEQMTAKGLVLYNDRWMSQDDKFRLEQDAKGLVLYQGQWVKKEDVQDAGTKIAAGFVFYNGKWISNADRMQSEGLVEFEEQWIHPAERDAILAQRKTAAAATQAQTSKVDQLKKVALLKSQDFLRRQVTADSFQFDDVDNPKVKVILDDGWYIVRGVVHLTSKDGSVSVKVYYCKLHPKDNGDWEADSTVVMD